MLNIDPQYIKRNIRKVRRDPKLFLKDMTYKRAPTLLRAFEDVQKKVDSIIFVTDEKITEQVEEQELTVTDYNHQLYEFTKRYAVNSMQIGDEYIWPYLRNHILVNLYATWRGRTAFKQMNPLALSSAHFSMFPNDVRIHCKTSIEAKDYDNLEDDKCDFLFVLPHSGFGRVEIKEAIHHRLVDPIYEVATKLGKARKVEFLANPNPDFIDLWHKYEYKTLSVLPPKFQKSGYFIDLDYRDDFFANYKELLKTQNPVNRHILNTVVDNEIFSREWYKTVLEQIKPKVIFLSLFHYNAALISAADELGILTVDVQHGLQVGDGVLYNHHEEIPSSGYQAYPDYFAVWGKKEFEGIQENFKGKKHKPILLGNPWLNKLKGFENKFTSAFRNVIKKEKRLIGLIILKDQETIQETYKDIIKATKDSVFWLVRHHPTARKYFSTRDFVSGLINNQVMISDELDKGNLCHLLQEVDLTLSEGSALAYEASHYGIKNFVFSDYAADNFAVEIKKGGFYLINDAKDFVEQFEELNFTNKSNVVKPFADVDLAVFLDDLLQASLKKSVKTNPLKAKDVMAIKEFSDKVEEFKADIDSYVSQGDIIKAVKKYYNLREVLSVAPHVEKLYEGEQDFFRKESKIFQKKLHKNILVDSYDIFLVSDSLGLPRPNETVKSDFGLLYTTAGQFNANHYNQANGHGMMTWAQRYLTTEKLLNNWKVITSDGLKDKHFIVHLGLNDSSERIFQERERLALDLLDSTTKRDIVNFGKTYRKEVIENQYEYNYVNPTQFRENLEKIADLAKKQGAKSVSFVNILYFPKSHEITTPRSIANTKKYNDIIADVVKQSDDVFLIDLDDKFCMEGKSSCLLQDNMHLSPKGHKVFAEHISSLVQTKKSYDFNIAIIGVGQLGSRYLQGLKKLEFGEATVNIELLEKFEDAQKTAVERYSQIDYKGPTKKQIKFVNDIDGLSDCLDLVIIATGADIRANLLAQLINKKTFKNIILEKVLFQELSNYEHFKSEFDKIDTKIWVNHPRREFAFYKNLISDIAKSGWVDFSVSGKNWGMACNSLHFLDLIQFLQNGQGLTEKDVNLKMLTQKIVNSKRSGHYEVFGQVVGNVGKANVSLSCHEGEEDTVSATINIDTDTMRMAINEINGQVSVAYADDDWKWRNETINIVEYQSDLTKRVVESILQTGCCTLPRYDEACLLHKPFINIMLNVLNDYTGDEDNAVCRIT